MSTPRDAVQFTRESADRIAGVVRTLELTPASGAALNFEAVQEFRQRKVFRVCTFSGAWAVGSSKTVTFKNQTATPNTASVVNLFFPITAAGSRDCGIAKDGTAWYLIDVPLATASAVFVTSTSAMTFASATATATVISGTTAQNVITDIAITASLNTSDCTITIGKTLTTASMTLVTGTATAMVVSTTATAVFVTGTVTATYLTFG
jgi:hypothetical protein